MNGTDTYKKKSLAMIPALLIGLAAMTYGLLARGSDQRFAVAIVIALAAVADYIWLAIASGNWLDLAAVFSGSWIFTVGMGSMHICVYQSTWDVTTWLCLMLAYAGFMLGNFLLYMFTGKNEGIGRVSKLCDGFREKYPIAKERLFYIALSVSLMSLVCLVINFFIRGYFPLFSDSPSAYISFYTKFHVFTVAGTSASGLCYYNIKRGELSPAKKLVMWACIVYLTLVMPILVVSRGTFLVNAVYLTTVVFALNKKRFLALVICLVVMFGGYEIGTRLRIVTENDTRELFTAKDITLVLGDKTIELDNTPSSVLFVYSYLTVGHDNLDAAVKNSDSYSLGLRQLRAIDELVPIPGYASLCEKRDMTTYLVDKRLNTMDLPADAYYDFGAVGVFALMAIWSFGYAAMERYALKRESPFALMFLGYTMVAVMLSFFETWMACTPLYIPAGTAFLMLLLATRFKPKSEIAAADEDIQ